MKGFAKIINVNDEHEVVAISESTGVRFFAQWLCDTKDGQEAICSANAYMDFVHSPVVDVLMQNDELLLEKATDALQYMQKSTEQSLQD